MKFFSDCSGCIVCAYNGRCIAGHGDDFFKIASKDELIDRINNKNLSKKDSEAIENTLLEEYGYDIKNN